MLRILYFAKLHDELNCSEETLEWQTHFTTISDIKKQLQHRGEPWQSALNQQIMVAHNHQLAKTDQPVHDGDEIAFFPPVTGG